MYTISTLLSIFKLFSFSSFFSFLFFFFFFGNLFGGVAVGLCPGLDTRCGRKQRRFIEHSVDTTTTGRVDVACGCPGIDSINYFITSGPGS